MTGGGKAEVLEMFGIGGEVNRPVARPCEVSQRLQKRARLRLLLRQYEPVQGFPDNLALAAHSPARRYRGKEEVEDAWKKDPVKRLRAWLEAQKAWDQKREDAWQAECGEWMDNEVNTYLETKAQPVTAMFDYTFAELPADLVKQREEAIALEKEAH